MSQNLRLALWVPPANVNTGDTVVTTQSAVAGNAARTTLQAIVAGSGGSGGGGGNAPVVGTLAPPSPVVGDLWVDITNPVSPQVKIFRQGNAWVVLADTDILPKATQPGELLVSGSGPNFDWNSEQGLIEGVY